MIQIGRIEFITDSNGLDQMKENVTLHTCKTNIDPQLMFRQSFAGVTKKLFVGNWTDQGFWISRYKLQLYQFRPDIICRFNIENRTSTVKVNIQSSIGFSSLFTGMIIIILFSAPFVSSGKSGFLTAVVIMTILYVCLASVEYDKTIKAIKNNVVNGIQRTNSSLDK
ncbi:MAG: hypothetical protein ACM3O8_11170 [Methylococcaceae bacterium]|nr:hypothetical protein [Prolixibacteraceae bacterium]